MYRLLHLHSVEAIASNYSRTAGGLRNYIPNRLPVSCISNQFIGVRLDARRERERERHRLHSSWREGDHPNVYQTLHLSLRVFGLSTRCSIDVWSKIVVTQVAQAELKLRLTSQGLSSWLSEPSCEQVLRGPNFWRCWTLARHV